MAVSRILRLNSLMKEALSEVIHKDLHHMPLINERVTITRVDMTSDLEHAKVYISVLGLKNEKEEAIKLLTSKAGTIAHMCSKKVRMYQFPKLVFKIDEELENQLHIEEVLVKLSKERQGRE